MNVRQRSNRRGTKAQLRRQALPSKRVPAVVRYSYYDPYVDDEHLWSVVGHLLRKVTDVWSNTDR